MKNHQNATSIIAGVLPAMALFATPAAAQELQTQTVPPPVATQPAPAPAAAEPAATPSATTTTTSADAQARYQASLDAATGRTAGTDAPAASDAAPPARAAVRPAPAPRGERAAPAASVAAMPTQANPAAPVADAPSPAAGATVDPAPTASAPASTAAETQTEQTGTTSGTLIWAWLIGALAAVGAVALGIFALRRRREDDEAWVEQNRFDEVAPVAASPLALDEPVTDHAEIVAPPAADIAAITDAAAPVAGRPWIELSLRPVRAGATDDAALVDLELTLANAGEVYARDVRVSTFMLGDAAGAPTDIERLLAAGHAGTEVDAGAIGAGEGSRIDARLALPRAEMDGATRFQPLVVADVRYTLPDGGEGRTAAAFAVGVLDDGAEPTPLRLGGDLREDVAATLHGVPERA